jgi:hypothetical protein
MVFRLERVGWGYVRRLETFNLTHLSLCCSWGSGEKIYLKIYIVAIVVRQAWWYRQQAATKSFCAHTLHVSVCAVVRSRVSGNWSMTAINGEETRCVCVFDVYVCMSWLEGSVDGRRWNETVMLGREAEGCVGRKLERLHRGIWMK